MTNTMSETNVQVAIFAKTPIMGEVKTRLIPELGPVGALKAHLELLQRTLTNLSSASVDARFELWVTSYSQSVQDCADQHDLVLKIQSGESLGERMKNAMGSMFTNGADLAFIVGSDCPELNSDYLTMMIQKSSEQDLLLAPAEDGGYCLIASRSLHSELFSGIEWGEAQVLEETLCKADALGLSVYLGPTIWDVDRPEDWRRYKKTSFS